jgi:hypothetical protein
LLLLSPSAASESLLSARKKESISKNLAQPWILSSKSFEMYKTSSYESMYYTGASMNHFLENQLLVLGFSLKRTTGANAINRLTFEANESSIVAKA